MSEKGIIFFTHSMKTAGRSLNQLFVEKFGKEAVVQIYQNETLMCDYIRQRRRKTLRYVCGHVDYGVHKFLGITDPVYITFLRDPLSRVISEYYYFRDFSIKHPSHELVVEAGSILGWIKSNKRQKNIQCHRLCGQEAETNAENSIDILFNKYAFFGLLEDFQFSVKTLCEQFDIPFDSYVPAANVGKYTPLADEEKAALLSASLAEDSMDYLLTNAAKELYVQRYGREAALQK
jgi:hypothetical protein